MQPRVRSLTKIQMASYELSAKEGRKEGEGVITQKDREMKIDSATEYVPINFATALPLEEDHFF